MSKSYTAAQTRSWREEKRRQSLIHDVAFLSKHPEWVAILPSLPPSPPHGTDDATLAAFSVAFKAAVAPLYKTLNERYGNVLKTHGLYAPETAAARDVLIAWGRWSDAVCNPPPPPPPPLPPKLPKTAPTPEQRKAERRERRAMRDEMNATFARLAAESRRRRQSAPSCQMSSLLLPASPVDDQQP